MKFKTNWVFYNKINKNAEAFFKKAQQYNMPYVDDVSGKSLVSPENDEAGPYWPCATCGIKIRNDEIGDIDNFKQIRTKEFVPDGEALTHEDIDNVTKNTINNFDAIISDRFGRQIYDVNDATKDVLARMDGCVASPDLYDLCIKYKDLLPQNFINIYNSLKSLFTIETFRTTQTTSNDPEVIKKHLFGLQDVAESILTKIKSEFEKIVGKHPQEEITVIKEAPICPKHDAIYYCDFAGCQNSTEDFNEVFTVDGSAWNGSKTIDTRHQYCSQHGARCNSCGQGLTIGQAISSYEQEPVEFEGDTYHASCFYEDYRECYECDNYFNREDLAYDETTDKEYCESCYTKILDGGGGGLDTKIAKKSINEIQAVQGVQYPLDLSVIVGNILPVLESAYKKFGDFDFGSADYDKVLNPILAKIQKPDAKAAVETELKKSGLETTIGVFKHNILYQNTMKEKYPKLKGYRPLPVDLKVNGGGSHTGMVFAVYPSAQMLAWADKILPGAKIFYEDVLRNLGHHPGALGYARLSQSKGNILIDNLQTDIDKQSESIKNYSVHYSEQLETRMNFDLKNLALYNQNIEFMMAKPEDERDYADIDKNKRTIEIIRERIENSRKLLENFDAYISWWTKTIDKFWAPYLLDVVKQYARLVDKKAYLTSYDMQKEKWRHLPERNKDVYDRLPAMMDMEEATIYARPEDLEGKDWSLRKVAKECDLYYRKATKKAYSYVR